MNTDDRGFVLMRIVPSMRAETGAVIVVQDDAFILPEAMCGRVADLIEEMVREEIARELGGVHAAA